MGFFDRFRKSDNKNESAKDKSTSIPKDNNIEEPIIREEPSGSGTYIYRVDENKTINEHLQIIANELLIKNRAIKIILKAKGNMISRTIDVSEILHIRSRPRFDICAEDIKIGKEENKVGNAITVISNIAIILRIRETITATQTPWTKKNTSEEKKKPDSEKIKKVAKLDNTIEIKSNSDKDFANSVLQTITYLVNYKSAIISGKKEYSTKILELRDLLVNKGMKSYLDTFWDKKAEEIEKTTGKREIRLVSDIMPTVIVDYTKSNTDNIEVGLHV